MNKKRIEVDLDLVVRGLETQGYKRLGGSDVWCWLEREEDQQTIKVYYNDYVSKDHIIIRESTEPGSEIMKASKCSKKRINEIINILINRIKNYEKRYELSNKEFLKLYKQGIASDEQNIPEFESYKWNSSNKLLNKLRKTKEKK